MGKWGTEERQELQDVAANMISLELIPSRRSPQGRLPVCQPHQNSLPVFSPMPHTQVWQPSEQGMRLASTSLRHGKVGFEEALQEMAGPRTSSLRYHYINQKTHVVLCRGWTSAPASALPSCISVFLGTPPSGFSFS